MIGEVSYHDYYGVLVDPEERDLIARNLGPVNKVRNLWFYFSICFLSLFPLRDANDSLLSGDVSPQPRTGHLR